MQLRKLAGSVKFCYVKACAVLTVAIATVKTAQDYWRTSGCELTL